MLTASVFVGPVTDGAGRQRLLPCLGSSSKVNRATPTASLQLSPTSNAAATLIEEPDNVRLLQRCIDDT